MRGKRSERLGEAFEKFLCETLGEMRGENLDMVMKGVGSQTVESYCRLFVQTVGRNSREEFQEILRERAVLEKLDRLDELVRGSGQEVDMNAFKFVERDPESVKEAVVSQARREEGLRLRGVLERLREENAVLREREAEGARRLGRLREEASAVLGELGGCVG